jgi:hypothetical protein
MIEFLMRKTVFYKDKNETIVQKNKQRNKGGRGKKRGGECLEGVT